MTRRWTNLMRSSKVCLLTITLTTPIPLTPSPSTSLLLLILTFIKTERAAKIQAKKMKKQQDIFDAMKEIADQSKAEAEESEEEEAEGEDIQDNILFIRSRRGEGEGARDVHNLKFI